MGSEPDDASEDQDLKDLQASLARRLKAERALWVEARKDPVAFFADRPRWPTHLSEEEAFTRTFYWASRLHLHGTFGRVAHDALETGTYHLAREWPLPVGRKALRKHADDILRRGTEGYHGNPLALHDAMPFAGD